MSNNYALIKHAIINKKIVIAIFNGQERQMCPHVIGKNKEGRDQALFYQFGGSSNSKPIIPGSTENWRCMPISELQNIRIIDGHWHTALNHSIPQTCVDSVDVQVKL